MTQAYDPHIEWAHDKGSGKMSMAYGNTPPRATAVKYDHEAELGRQSNRLVQRISETDASAVRQVFGRLIARAEKTWHYARDNGPDGAPGHLSFEDILEFVNAQLNEAERTVSMKVTPDERETLEALRAGTAGVTGRVPKLPPRPGSERHAMGDVSHVGPLDSEA